MQVLLIRHDSDGYTFWKTYDASSRHLMTLDILAHLNTMSVVKLELIPGDEMGRPPSMSG